MKLEYGNLKHRVTIEAVIEVTQLVMLKIRGSHSQRYVATINEIMLEIGIPEHEMSEWVATYVTALHISRAFELIQWRPSKNGKIYSTTPDAESYFLERFIQREIDRKEPQS
ncbi:MAG: hypothetical protein ACYCOU_24140 [Sulfobacillus sp.]